MMKEVVALVVIAVVVAAAYLLITAPVPVREAYLMLPSVSGTDDNCVFADITDLVQSGVLFDTTLYNFTAQELISLHCLEDDRSYGVMVYLDVSPFEKREIESALPTPTTVLSGRNVYPIAGNNYFVPIESEFYFYSFDNVPPFPVINDSLNSRNSYSLDESFAMLARIPDRIEYMDSELRQIRTEFGDTKQAIKEWYVGTTLLAASNAYIVLREPNDPDIILGCSDENSTYDNTTTSSGMFYICKSGNMCGPKYLIMDDSFAYTQIPMVCDSVEDAFTTAIIERVTESSGR
ncbi:MAG: hypothetical protein ACXADB_11340 [Candidatus Hermodarchaeia archaeon]|jgi:hypothetical protein